MTDHVFPQPPFFMNTRGEMLPHENRPHGGLTRRELFAAMAMQGLLAMPSDIDIEPGAGSWPEAYAKHALQAADALIAALDQP